MIVDDCLLYRCLGEIMSVSAIMLASVLASAMPSSSDAPPDQTATLSFNSQTQVLDGYAYGIEAVDGQALGFGQKLSAEVAVGRKTVLYSCPNNSGGSALTFDFLPGRKYELVCNPDAEAEIRPADC
jgi:hypothetical protein